MKYIFYYLIFTAFVSSCIAPKSNSNYHYQNQFVFNNITIPKENLNCDCHTQGIAWNSEFERLIITCQGSDKKSHALLFSYNNEETIKFITSINTDGDGLGLSHPSATQFYKNIFPIALAGAKEDSTLIKFYTITSDSIKSETAMDISYPKHIGALSITSWNNKVYLFGAGWDSKYYALWRSNDLENLKFELIDEGNFSKVTNSKSGAYNSLWMGLNDQGKLELLASCGNIFNKKKNFIDMYDVEITEDHLSLKNNKRIYVKGITEKTIKSLFFEGVTVKNYGKDSIEILSAPQDFKVNDKMTILKKLY